jgi:hypothetical protein
LDRRDHTAQRLAFGGATAQTLPPALTRHTHHRVWFQWTSAGLVFANDGWSGPDGNELRQQGLRSRLSAPPAYLQVLS